MKALADPKTAIAQALHETYCLPGARHRDQWTNGHREVDRSRAVQVYTFLVHEGVLPSPPVAARLLSGLSEDFLAPVVVES